MHRFTKGSGIWLMAATGLLLTACGDSADPGLVQDAGAAFDASASLVSGSGVLDAGLAQDASAGDAGVQPRDECDPVMQSGCSPPDTKCVVEGALGTECIEPRATDAAFGESCMGRDCVAGLVCAQTNTGTTAGECIQVCNPTSGVGCESLGNDYDCTTILTGTNWGACRELNPECNPYTQDPCASQFACQPLRRRSGAWEFRCRLAGAAADGSPCGPGSNMSCQRGSACVADPSGNSVCRKICQTTMDCENSEQCAGSVPTPSFMYCAP